MSTLLEDQPTLIRALLRPEAYPFACRNIELVETHISWVFLTGDFAFKLKKPLDLGFLDFTTLEQRHHFCREELRLNSRLAGDLYLAVVPICGTPEHPVVDGDGEPFEYAVKMHQFDQNLLLSLQLDEGRLEPHHIDSLAELTADLHSKVERASADDRHGTPELAHAPCLQNFQQLGALIRDPARLARLDALRRWTETAFERLKPLMGQRKREGFVRECHGDLHLGNVTQRGNEVLIFDGIEFNENFRWIDVMSEVAFLFTDLEHRGRPDLAWRALNHYLEITGDYSSLPLLGYYCLHRIMVRTKIDAFRLEQPGLDDQERQTLERELDHYFDQAEKTVQDSTPSLFLTRGLSGSGKTYLSQRLLEALGAIRVRSDVERKRHFGLAPTARSNSPIDQGIYSTEATVATFERLLELAGTVLDSGYTTIVDASFLDRKMIEPFRLLAESKNIPFLVLDLRAPSDLLRERLQQRAADPKEASEAGLDVLSAQLERYQSLDEDYSVAIESDKELSVEELLRLLKTQPR